MWFPLRNTLACMASVCIGHSFILHWQFKDFSRQWCTADLWKRHYCSFCTKINSVKWWAWVNEWKIYYPPARFYFCFPLEDGTSGIHLFDIHDFFWSPDALALPLISFLHSANAFWCLHSSETKQPFLPAQLSLVLLLEIIHVPTVLIHLWKGEGLGYV